jgi:type I restriction enzyme S subunit
MTIVNPYFLMHCIRGCPAVLAQVQGEIQGVTRPGINGTILKEIRIPLPPLTEQHEIVCRVEALFKIADQIEKRYKKAKAYIDKLTQSILAKAFCGELVPQDLNDDPASALLTCIQREREGR